MSESIGEPAEIGTRLRTQRAALRLTQAQVAERSGIAALTVHRIETGKGTPHRSTLEVIARALGCPVDFLTGDTQHT